MRATLLRFDRLRSAVGAWLVRMGDASMTLGIAMIVGVASSIYMVRFGSPLTTRTIGVWTTWPAAGRADADPYTRVHFAWLGSLPLTSAIGQTYEAYLDSDGQRLQSSCEYEIEGYDTSTYWSLAVYNADGLMVANAAERYAFGSETIARRADGSFIIVLAREARPGNWLPTTGMGRLSVLLTIMQATAPDASGRAAQHAESLPTIRRTACR
ncbi:MAG: DUF1214 domain-containing protein [Hyphomicrobiaceae bacterium]